MSNQSMNPKQERITVLAVDLRTAGFNVSFTEHTFRVTSIHGLLGECLQQLHLRSRLDRSI